MFTEKGMGNMYPEHRDVMDNFIAMVRKSLKASLCMTMREAKYMWPEDVKDGQQQYREPDISILCGNRSRKKLAYTDVPRFVAEVLSQSTEEMDRGEKFHLYELIGVQEYWLVDWRQRRVEIFMLDDAGQKYELYDTISEKNKEELHIISFPHIQIDFDELFDFER